MATPTRPTASPEQIHTLLRRWQHEGLIDAGAVARIEAAEAAEAARAAPGPAKDRREGASLIGEALGYVGGTLIVAAIVVLVGREWNRLAIGVQIALLGGGAALLLIAGLLMSGRTAPAVVRLRAMLWTMSTGLAFAMWVLIGGDRALSWSPRERVLVAGLLAAAQAIVLWMNSRAVLLHLATFASLAAAAGAAGQFLTGLHDQGVGVGLVLFGTTWVVLGLLDVIRPQLVACLAGTMLTVTGALTTAGARWGAILIVAVAVAVVGLAVWQRSLPILVVGTYAMLVGIPVAASRLFHGSIAVAGGLLVAGVVLVGAARWIMTRGEEL